MHLCVCVRVCLAGWLAGWLNYQSIDFDISKLAFFLDVFEEEKNE